MFYIVPKALVKSSWLGKKKKLYGLRRETENGINCRRCLFMQKAQKASQIMRNSNNWARFLNIRSANKTQLHFYIPATNSFKT